MDDTTQSRTSDAAAATRKRRSSILKSQRPPRTPFCELEFNVCTPPEMSKSRRVSFSRRTGVAEFATNEATTTWKNFYEEHNKSLELSGNDSDVNCKQPIAHLGKRIFDQQFEEVEAADLIGSLHNGLNISTSVTNINIAQLESTEKLTAPLHNFELSAFTEQQSKLFSDDLAVTCHGNVTGGIDVNFSTIQPIGEKDDLDEIQKDLQQRNVASHSLFGRQNLSEYIEVDLNTTHVAMANDESDMSITDTVYSPKVQDVSKSFSVEKKVSVTKDWVADKENIVVNPYVAPRESLNFAVNDEVLIFDGKKLIIRTESPTPKNENYRQTLLPNPSEIAPQRKTIVLNCNDDLPNFIEDEQAARNVSNLVGVCEQKQSLILDMSMPQPRLDAMANNHRTIIYDENSGNISVTQAVPNLISNSEKHRTILYDNGNMSVTQAIPSTIIDKEKRRTIVYDNDNDISTTQAVPANLLLFNENNQKRKTIVFENEGCDISMTQALPAKIIAPDTASRTVVIEDGTANISITKPTTNIVESNKKRRTVAYENNTGNISVTHSVTSKSNINSENAVPDRRRTIVFESDVGNISVTQALPTNIIMPQNLNVTTYGNDANISMTRVVPTNILLEDKKGINRRRTVVFEDDTGNLSITQTVSTNQVIQGLAYQSTESNDIVIATNEVLHINKVNTNNTRTIVFESDNQNISMTQAVNTNQILSGLTKQNETSCDSSQKLKQNQRRTIVFEDNDADISMTQVVNVNELIFTENKDKQNVSLKELEVATNTALHYDNSLRRRRTITYDDDKQDKSLMSIISKMSSIPTDEQEKEIVTRDMSLLDSRNIFTQADELELNGKNIDKVHINRLSNMKRTKKIIEYENDNDVSINRAILEKFGSKVPEDRTVHDKMLGISKPIPADLSAVQFNEIKTSKSKERESMLMSLTNMAVDDIFVYQAKPVEQKEDIENIDQQKAEVDDGKASFIALTNMLKTSSGSSAKITPKCETQDLNDTHSDVMTSDLESDKTSEMLSEKDDNEDKLKVTGVESSKMIKYEEDSDTAQDLPEFFHSKVTQEKSLKIEESALLLSKPIPSELSTDQLDSIKNSHISMKKRESILTDLTDIPVDDIVVYHKVDSITKQMEQSNKIDLSKVNAFPIEYDRATSPIVIDSIAKLSNDIDTPQDDLNAEEDQTCQVPEEISSKDSATRVTKPINPILNNLLDMSETSLGGEEDKSLMAKISSERVSRLNSNQVDTVSSKEDMFFITNENSEDAQLDKPDEIKETWEVAKLSSFPPKIESEENVDVDGGLQSKITELKNVFNEHNLAKPSSPPETILSSKPGSTESFDVPKKLNMKGFKMANDTNELLEMLSDFTDKPISKNLDPHIEEREDESDINLEGDISLDKHNERNESEPKRLSIAPKRHSMALSREDLLNNLSMAAEALRKSRFELDESETADDIVQETPQQDDTHKKHVSSGVVKALHFDDDDSLCQKSGSHQHSALKKTAFGEAAYMKESKSKVIPDYLEETDLKALMNDLVKPMADVLPYTTTTLGRGVKKSASMCSTQIQANLLNTSQVDLQSELYSNPESMYDIRKFSSTDSTADPPDRSVSRQVSSTTSLSQSEKILEIAYNRAHENRRRENHASHVPQSGYIIFDHSNPLNNILLPPLDVDVHSYNPIPSDEATNSSSKILESAEEGSSSAVTKFVSNQYRLESKLTIPLPATKLITKVDAKPTLKSDKLTKSDAQDQKDTQVNTVIVMKGNQELLAQSSSLTLVDDALTHSRFDLKIEDDDDKLTDSSIELIYKLNKTEQKPADSDMAHSEEVQEIHKPKKRTYSPKSRRDKPNQSSSADVTPKPAFKMQKRSFSPTRRRTISPTRRGLASPNTQRSASPTNMIQSTNPTIQPSSLETQIQQNHTTTMRSPSSDSEMRSDSPSVTTQSVSSSKLVRSVSPDMKMQSDNHKAELSLDNPEMQVRSVSPMIQVRPDNDGMPVQLPEVQVRSVSTMVVRSVNPEMIMRSAIPETKTRSESPEKQMRSVSPMIQMRGASPEKTMRSVSPMIPMLLTNPETQMQSAYPETIVRSVSPMVQMRLNSPELQIRTNNPDVLHSDVQALIPDKQTVENPDVHMDAISPDKHMRAFTAAMRMQVTPDKLMRTISPVKLLRALSPTRMQPSPEKRPLSPEKLMQGISPEKHTRILSPDKLRISPDARIRTGNSDGRMRTLSPEQRMRAVSPNVKMQSFSPPTPIKPSSAMTQSMNMDSYIYEKPFRLSPERKKNADSDKSKSPKKQNSPKRRSPTRMKGRKPGTNVTIQHVTTVVNPEAASKENWQRLKGKEKEMEDRIDAKIDAMRCDDLDIPSPDVSSLASSKNLTESIHNQLKADWAPKSCSEISSKSSLESDMDVILKIDSMPFMGSSDCEWESATSEAWSFLLLHARLRFTVRFAAGHRVKGDTPVTNLALETLHQEKKNPIALLCVTYAAEMMRYYMSRGCCAARDVPRLIRQLGGTARVAARWARAMHDARARLAFSLTPDGFLALKARLAFSLTPDGFLALKVANASLRTVWEVTMQLELVVADARSAPWPRAARVSAARVLAGRTPTPAALRRLLKHSPNDWGHAPNTIWKIFRYLKHKKRDDDEIAPFV